MASAPVTFPWLASDNGQIAVTRPQITDSSNTFAAYQFVKVSSNALAECATDDVVCYGLVMDPSHTSTDAPFVAPFGELHEVIDPANAQFVVNITDSSGTVGSGSTRQIDVAIGTAYALYLGSGDYDGIAFVDKSDTTNDFFIVQGRYEGDASTDFNGRVYVSLADGVRQ